MAFVAVNQGSEFWETVKEYEQVLQKLSPDTAALKAWEDTNREKIQRLIAGYESEWKHKYQWPRLNPANGR